MENKHYRFYSSIPPYVYKLLPSSAKKKKIQDALILEHKQHMNNLLKDFAVSCFNNRSNIYEISQDNPNKYMQKRTQD